MDYLYDEIEDPTLYKVVLNKRGQFSIWFANRPNPNGWSDKGFQGTKDECLEYIEKIWLDMKPSN